MNKRRFQPEWIHCHQVSFGLDPVVRCNLQERQQEAVFTGPFPSTIDSMMGHEPDFSRFVRRSVSLFFNPCVCVLLNVQQGASELSKKRHENANSDKNIDDGEKLPDISLR